MIALYLHDTRREHLDRALALVTALPRDTTVVSPRPRPFGCSVAWAHLPDAEPGTWRRWLQQTLCTAAVVDGPPAFASAAADTGVRLAVVAEPGGGNDGERGPAYAAADVILAPWAPLGLDTTWPTAWRERTVHLGAIGHRANTAVLTGAGSPTVRSSGGRWNCVVLSPTGAGPGPRDRWAMSVGTPAWRWTYAQEREVLEDGPLWSTLARCEVAVCAPTTATVAALAACRVPALLVLPERPTRAQQFLAETARRTAPVVVVQGWPLAEEWRFLLDRVRALDGKGWEAWSPATGISELVAALTAPATPERKPETAEPVLLSPA